MNIFSKLKCKIVALFRHQKKEHLTEHGNIVIEFDPIMVVHLPSKNGRLKHLAEHARKRRVRKKNQRRLSERQNR